MTKKKRSVLLSVLTLVLCLSVVAAGTYALFSDQVTLRTHLEAGKLDITLWRTNLVTKSLNSATGYLVGNEYPDDVNFSEATTKNLFEITDKTLIVPCCEYTAEMKIENNSDVAFGYWIEVVFDDKDNLALADQLKVTVTRNGVSTSKFLSEGLEVGTEENPIGTLAKTGYELFYINVEFVSDDDVNNDAKAQSLDFDIVVHAIQVTEAP